MTTQRGFPTVQGAALVPRFLWVAVTSAFPRRLHELFVQARGLGGTFATPSPTAGNRGPTNGDAQAVIAEVITDIRAGP